MTRRDGRARFHGYDGAPRRVIVGRRVLRNSLAFVRPVLAVKAVYLGLDVEVRFVT